MTGGVKLLYWNMLNRGVWRHVNIYEEGLMYRVLWFLFFDFLKFSLHVELKLKLTRIQLNGLIHCKVSCDKIN